MRQTDYRRRNTALSEEIFEELQKVSQDELNWLFRQIRYKVRRLDGQRMKVTTANPRLQKSYVVSGNLWDFFMQRMRRALTRAIMKGAIKLATLQRNHFASFKPVEFDPEEFARFIEPQIGERIVGVSNTIKRQVGVKVVGWYNSPGATMQSLVDQLKPTFGEKRARLIAQTEVTRLNSEVKRLTADQIGATEWWWSTRRDNLVCVKPLRGPDGKVYKGCRELHGKTFDIGLLMPPDGSHPGCRCDPVIVPPSTAGRVKTAKPVAAGLLMQKYDPNEPRDEDGKWTSGHKSASGDFEWTRDPEVTREESVKFLQRYIDEKMPTHLRGQSEARHVEVFDNPEDVYRRLEELGIEPDIGNEGVVRGAYDFQSRTIYTSLWDGYRDSEKNFLHELGHSILGEDEDTVLRFVEDYYNDPDEQLTLKTMENDDEKYEIPMPMIDNESKKGAKSYLASLSPDEQEEQYKTEELNISELQSGQPSIRKETVDYFLNGGKPGFLEEFIRVARVNGKLYLMNGNHRVVASMLQGAKSVKAKVIDIPPLTKADFIESEHPRDEDGKFTDKGMGVSGGSSEPAYKQTDEYKEFTAAIKRYHELTDPYDKMDALRDAENAMYLHRKEMIKDYFDGKVPEFSVTAYKKGSGTDIGEIAVFTDFEKAKESLQEGETLKAFDVLVDNIMPIDKQNRTCITDGAYLRDERPVDLNYQPPKEKPVTNKLADTDYNEAINQVFNLLKVPEAVEKYNTYHNFIKMKPKVTPTEYVEECEKRLKKAIEDTDVCVRLPVASLNKVLEQGSYKSAFESQKSGAGGFAGGIENRERYLKIRRRAENQMFGIPEAQETDRPVYGYLAGKGSVNPNSEDLEQYGNVALVLKDSVRERTTFTQGDSLDDVNMKGIYGSVLPNGQKIWSGKGSPSKLTDPKIQSLTYLEYWSGRDWLTNAELYEEKPEEDNNAVPQKERKYDYWEAQISSGFSVSEIASVAFIGKEPGSKTTKALDKLGIPWKVVEGYVEKMLKADQPEGVLIARSDYLALYALDGETGYVVNTETGKRYPTHMLASILSRGYWEMVEEEDLNKFDPNEPRDEDGKWTDGGKVARKPKHGDNQPIRTQRVLPGTKYSKLVKPEFLYHVSGATPEDIKEKGLLRSSKASKFSGDYAVDWEVDHPVDGVFLANWEQAKILKEQNDEAGLESHIYEVWLPTDTVLYNDWMMPESSVQVEGDIEPERIDMLPDDFVPYKPEKSKRLLTSLRWQEYNGDEPYEPDLTKWDEQKHPRRKDGEFAPKGMGETGGGAETRPEHPAKEKSASNPDRSPEIGNEVEGRPQMGRNFDFSAERDMFGSGKGYTQEQYMRFNKRKLAVMYAETEPFNNEMTQKEYIDKYIRRGWYPTDEDEPYQLVNPEGTRKRTVSRQGMKDYLDVVLNRGEYKANYDLPEGANVVPERGKKPAPEPETAKPEPVSYPDGASVAKFLSEYAGEYDENSVEVKKRKTFLETAKLELKKYGDDELRDENNKEALSALRKYTDAMLYLKIEIDHQKEKARYEKGLELTRVEDPVKMNPRLSPEFKGKKINEVNGAIQAFEGIVSARTGLRVTDVRFDLRPKGRSSYNHDNLRVTLSKQEMTLNSAIIHELGHHFEFEAPGIRIAAQKFFQKRTQGEKTVSMNKYNKGYRPDEVCKPDKFIDPYVGKIYSDGSTEIISVGLASYYTDPVQFAKDDPEHFALIYDAVHGKFSNNL